MTITMRKLVLGFALGSLAVILPACQPPKQDKDMFSFDRQKYKLPKYDSLEYFYVSPDGGRFLALYKKKDKWYAQINKITYENFQGTFLDSFANKPKYIFNSDSTKVGLVYQRERPVYFRAAPDEDGEKMAPADTLPQWFVQINQTVYGGFDGDLMPEIKYHPDGTAFGFVCKKRGQYYVRLNDDEFGPYQKADLAIAPNGRITIARIEKGYAMLEEIEMIPNPRIK